LDAEIKYLRLGGLKLFDFTPLLSHWILHFQTELGDKKMPSFSKGRNKRLYSREK
jgi:hypothetical protein